MFEFVREHGVGVVWAEQTVAAGRDDDMLLSVHLIAYGSRWYPGKCAFAHRAIGCLRILPTGDAAALIHAAVVEGS